MMDESSAHSAVRGEDALTNARPLRLLQSSDAGGGGGDGAGGGGGGRQVLPNVSGRGGTN
jgi:hypothetical protein